VKDIVGPVLCEDVFDAVAVRHVSQRRNHVDLRMGARDLEVDEIEWRFRALEQDQAGRSKGGQLPRQLRADGSCGAGDEDRATGYFASDRPKVERNGLATEKVFDSDLAEASAMRKPGEHLCE